MKHKINRGDIIVRRNLMPFRNGMPVLRVREVSLDRQYQSKEGVKREYLINRVVRVRDDAVNRIDEEEAERIINLWNNLSISETRDGGHFRQDNNSPKVDLGDDWKDILFHYTLKYPENQYNVYTCSVCEALHLGKL